jgi:hypothetical protein
MASLLSKPSKGRMLDVRVIIANDRSFTVVARSSYPEITQFPVSVTVQNPFLIRLFSGPDFVKGAFVAVSLCEKGSTCDGKVPPVFLGSSRIKLPQAETQLPQTLEADPLYISSFTDAFNLEACEKAKSTISGQLLPSEKFLSKFAPGTKILLLGIPTSIMFTLQDAALVSQGMRRGSISDAVMEHLGITSDLLVLRQTGTEFTFKIPKGFEQSRYRFAALVCDAGDTQDVCAAKSFPFFIMLN